MFALPLHLPTFFPYTTLFRSLGQAPLFQPVLLTAWQRPKAVIQLLYRRELSDLRQLPLRDRKSTRLNSSHVAISYAVFCLKKKTRSLNFNYNECTCIDKI